MNSPILYAGTVLIWGTTWFAIKLQLGRVDPVVSVFYRFALASAILLIYCRLFGLNMRYRGKDHLYMALQGILLFAINYWLFYVAETYVASGLAAVVFSTIIFMNIVNGRLFLHAPIRVPVVAGAAVGLVGMGFVFQPELSSLSLDDRNFLGLLLSVLATYSASLGNITSAFNQQKRLPVIQTNAFGMTYGAVVMGAFALFSGRSFGFEPTVGYVGSLIYLAVFGSVIAFGCYLTLVGRIGADRAAYATLLFPLVALFVSTIFESYRWTVSAALGVLLIIAGNYLALKERSRPPRVGHGIFQGPQGRARKT